MPPSIFAQLAPSVGMFPYPFDNGISLIAEIDSEADSLTFVVFDGAEKLFASWRQKPYVQVRPDSRNTSSAGIASRFPSRKAVNRASASAAHFRSRSGSGRSKLERTSSTTAIRSTGSSFSASRISFSASSVMIWFFRRGQQYRSTASIATQGRSASAITVAGFMPPDAANQRRADATSVEQTCADRALAAFARSATPLINPLASGLCALRDERASSGQLHRHRERRKQHLANPRAPESYASPTDV